MKKAIILSAMFMLFIQVINAQTNGQTVKQDIKKLNKQESAIKKEKREEKKQLRKLQGKEASYQSKQEFTRDFGDIKDVRWERTDYFEEATFTKDGSVFTAFYDRDAKLVGTTSEKTFSDLPKKAQSYITEKYPNYETKEVVLFDDNDQSNMNMIFYNKEFDSTDNYFVELKKENQKIVLRADTNGNVSYFTRLK